MEYELGPTLRLGLAEQAPSGIVVSVRWYLGCLITGLMVFLWYLVSYWSLFDDIWSFLKGSGGCCSRPFLMALPPSAGSGRTPRSEIPWMCSAPRLRGFAEEIGAGKLDRLTDR